MQHNIAMLASAALPAALRHFPSIRADGRDPNALLNQLNTAVSALRANVEGAINEDRQHIANLASALEAIQQQVGGGISPTNGLIGAVEPDYTRAFAFTLAPATAWRRSRRQTQPATVRKFTRPCRWFSDRRGSACAGRMGPQDVRAPARKLPHASARDRPSDCRGSVHVSVIERRLGLRLGWETAARPLTTTPLLSPIPCASGEIYANAAATQRLLEDAAINVDNWLVDPLAREFSGQENFAFLSGAGANKSNGLLTYAEGGSNETTHPGGDRRG